MDKIEKFDLNFLKLVRSKMDELKEEEFNFLELVSHYDIINDCGTVCCIAGWFPKWFPKNFKWDIYNSVNYIDNDSRIFYFLKHHYSYEILDLFFGFITEHGNERMRNEYKKYKSRTEATLEEVKQTWDAVFEAVENNTLEFKICKD
jgi:hypothetical protein